MWSSAATDRAISLMSAGRLDRDIAGKGLISFSLVFLLAAIPFVVSGAPAGLVAVAICLGYGGAGYGLVRRHVWAHHLLVLSGTLHVGLAVGWFMLLTRV